MRSEHSWSLVDPRPVAVYLVNVDDYLVYWNGKVMPHLMAMNMVMEYFGMYPTPEMKTAMEKNYERIYYSNGFATRAWDRRVQSGPIYPYLKRIMEPHLKSLITDKAKTISEVLSWFDYSKARIADD